MNYRSNVGMLFEHQRNQIIYKTSRFWLVVSWNKLTDRFNNWWCNLNLDAIIRVASARNGGDSAPVRGMRNGGKEYYFVKFEDNTILLRCAGKLS